MMTKRYATLYAFILITKLSYIHNCVYIYTNVYVLIYLCRADILLYRYLLPTFLQIIGSKADKYL